MTLVLAKPAIHANYFLIFPEPLQIGHVFSLWPNNPSGTQPLPLHLAHVSSFAMMSPPIFKMVEVINLQVLSLDFCHQGQRLLF